MSVLRRSRAAVLLACVLALALVVTLAVTLARGGSHSSLVWSDDFSGRAGAAPSAANWQTETGYYGAGNASLECFTSSRANSRLDGHGNLDIIAKQSPGAQCGSSGLKDYTSARLTSQGLHSMKYGYLQIRAKMAGGQGLWNALWLLGGNYAKVHWPQCGEIDLSEVTSRNPTATYATIHGPMSTGAPYSLSGERSGVGSLSTRFHTYGMSWSPTGLVFTFDHYVYYRISKSQVEAKGEWVFDKPFAVLLDLAVGGSWPGSPNSSTRFPATMAVSYVRVYSRVPSGA